MILQANKNAKDRNFRDTATKNSHDILGKIIVDPVKDKEGKTAGSDMLASFRARSK